MISWRKRTVRVAVLTLVLGGAPSCWGTRAEPEALLDINTATSAELIALPGMGQAYAARVIAGRPFTAKNQLVTRGILPATAYEQIKDRIVAHRIRANKDIR